MDEWKDFSLRNGIKFNILDAMRYAAAIFLSLFLPMSVYAQNTQTPETPPAVISVPQIMLDIKVVEIVLNEEHRSGVDWEAIVSDFHTLQLKKEDNPIWSDKRYQLSVGEVSNEDYAVLLDALDAVGHCNQKDFPQVTLSKNELKSVDVSADPKNLPTIMLDLMWVNAPTGEPKLKIDPSLGIIIKDNTKQASPVTLKSQTQMDLKDNTTVVIGSLMHEQEISKTKKIPLLGDIPLLGLVFRKQGILMQKTETIVFLTLHTNAIQMPEEESK